MTIFTKLTYSIVLIYTNSNTEKESPKTTVAPIQESILPTTHNRALPKWIPINHEDVWQSRTSHCSSGVEHTSSGTTTMDKCPTTDNASQTREFRLNYSPIVMLANIEPEPGRREYVSVTTMTDIKPETAPEAETITYNIRNHVYRIDVKLLPELWLEHLDHLPHEELNLRTQQRRAKTDPDKEIVRIKTEALRNFENNIIESSRLVGAVVD